MFPQGSESWLAQFRLRFARLGAYRQLLLSHLLDNVRGNRCILCAGRAQTRSLCRDCLVDLPWLGRSCSRCALPLPRHWSDQDEAPSPADPAICNQCLLSPPPWQQALALFHYEFPIDRLIAAYKYQGRLVLADCFGHLLAARCPPLPAQALLLPVPLHPARLRLRGYNQCTVLARILAQALERPCSLNQLQRRRDTPMQKTLHAQAREDNLKQAFVWQGEALCSRPVVLIDDVLTTGATLQAISATLRTAGAGDITVLVIARTLPA